MVLPGHKSAKRCGKSAYLRASAYLKIMVSPVRIRVPPLIKVLQIAKKARAPDVLPEPFDKGVSTAGSRKSLLVQPWRRYAFCGVGAEGEGHPDIVVISLHI